MKTNELLSKEEREARMGIFLTGINGLDVPNALTMISLFCITVVENIGMEPDNFLEGMRQAFDLTTKSAPTNKELH